MMEMGTIDEVATASLGLLSRTNRIEQDKLPIPPPLKEIECMWKPSYESYDKLKYSGDTYASIFNRLQEMMQDPSKSQEFHNLINKFPLKVSNPTNTQFYSLATQHTK